jgi:hypothetical protein
VIDYYERLMAAQQSAPEGARWHHDPSIDAQWRYSQPVEYVPDPQDQAPLYQPITPPRRADLYEPMGAPVSAYEGMPQPEEVVAALEEAVAAATAQQPMQVAMPQQQDSGGGGNYATPTPVYDAPQGPANVIGYQMPGGPMALNGYGGQGQPWGADHGFYTGNSGGGGLAYGGTDQPFTSNANSSSNPYTGGGGGGFSFW